MPIKSNQLSSETKVWDALSVPPDVGVGQGLFYPKDVGGVVEAFFKNSLPGEVQLTTGGAAVGQANTASNSGAGTGIGLFKTKLVADLVFKKIKAGTGITVTGEADDVTIASTVVAGEVNTGENVGASGIGVGVSCVGIFKQKDPTTKRLQFKTLKPGANIDVTESNDEITIAVSNLAQNTYTGSNVGTGEGSVFKEISNNDFKFKRVKAGTNVVVSETSTEITVSATGGGGGGGEANTASNSSSGTGVGLFKSKVGIDLVFKKIKAGSGITLTSYDDDLEINLSGGAGEANTASNATAGTGEGLIFKQKSGADLVLRKIKAGTNISIATGTDDITISSTATSGEANTYSSLGTGSDGEAVIGTKTGVDLPHKRIKSGANVTVTSSANSVTVAAVGDINAASNQGTGEGTIFKSKSANTLQLKTLKAGTGITINNNTDDITINSTGGGTTISRYQASATVNEEVEVLATGTGITYARSGTTGTFTVPAGVRLLSAKLRLPMATIGGTAFTVVYGTNGGADANTSFTDMFPPSQQCWREDSAAQVGTSSNYAAGKDRITVTTLASALSNILKLTW